ncbi:MAG: hypothetical protein QY314_03440 [Candidatus Dojkabacteria bacterium]|nr:MAG: hypothetical protein QY314_03440 [Candidatus Dojkabacteria bacterium]
MDFVPFQAKRRITSSKRLIKKAVMFGYLDSDAAKELSSLGTTETTSPSSQHFSALSLIAITVELAAYLKKQYALAIPSSKALSLADLEAIASSHASDPAALKTGTFELLLEAASLFSRFLTDIQQNKPVLHKDLQQLLVILQIVNQNLPSPEGKRYKILPPVYQTFVKRILTSMQTRDNIAREVESKKKSRKYLRILHKQYGIYSKKKPPFQKAPLQSKIS